MAKKKRLSKTKAKKLHGFVVDKLMYAPSFKRRKLITYLNKLKEKVNHVEYQRITKGGIWRIYVGFKEVEDASEFLMKFWRLKYKKSKFI